MSPVDPWDRVLERIILDTTGVFAEIEAELVRKVAVELRAGGLGDAPRVEAIMRLRQAGEAAAQQVRDGDLAAGVVARAVAEGESFAEAWMRLLLGDVPGVTLPHGAIATALLVQDLHNRFEDVTRRIVRWPADVYQQVLSRSAPGVLLGSDTSRSAQARAWRELRRRGVTGFVDSAGRRWNLATYVEMATRTATGRAFTEANLSTLASYGIDLVTAVGAQGQCEACGRWVGQVMSQDGTRGRVQVPHSTRDVLVWVNVKGTVDDAIADGFLHPNCRHTLVGYFPGLNNDTGPEWDARDEAAQADLRALEVGVRRAKRDALGALTDDEAREARKRVRALQARIREHVDETGEPRRREREQLNYGHHPGGR